MGRGLKGVLKKGLGQMLFNTEGGVVNWFPGHMAAATRAIRQRLKIPLSSVNADLQPQLLNKRRVIALNKKDLANPNIMHKWVGYFDSCKQDCIFINSHSKNSVQKVSSLSSALLLNIQFLCDFYVGNGGFVDSELRTVGLLVEALVFGGLCEMHLCS
ncbi:Short integuments 2, mitochondrial [Linum grandiflorum]